MSDETNQQEKELEKNQLKDHPDIKKHHFFRPLLFFVSGVLAVIGCYAYPAPALDAKTGGSFLESLGQFFGTTEESQPGTEADAAMGTVKAYAGGGGVGSELLTKRTLAGERKISLLRQGGKDIPNSYFNRSAFIGDSRTEGFLLYNGLTRAGNYGVKALTVDGFFQKAAITNGSGEKITVAEAIQNKEYDTFYIMFGMNELGWASEKTFIAKYGQVIDTIRRYHPDSKIVVQSILPVSAEKSASDPIHNNPKIVHYNQLIEQMCAEKSVDYFNVAARFMDDEGALFAEASTDGIHLNKKYCNLWMDYLKEQAALGQ